MDFSFSLLSGLCLSFLHHHRHLYLNAQARRPLAVLEAQKSSDPQLDSPVMPSEHDLSGT